MKIPKSRYAVEEWSKPRLLTLGITIPTTDFNEFYAYFMTVDSEIWEMTQAQRETWKNDILADWETYRRILYRDGTGIFHQQLKDMDRMGGGIILIPGEMGTGKSIIANTILKIWNIRKKNKQPPHIFWSKTKVRTKIKNTPLNTAHSIDEDMKPTGSGSGNLEVHLQNIFESIRKTGKLVIDVGVNVQPNKLARAVGLQLLPFGFNRKFQANRFIVCNWRGKPLWLAITQRFYYPQEKVFYEGELGVFGEYTSRALEFSAKTTGVFAGSDAEQELEWRTQLVKHWKKDWKDDKPSMEVLEFEAIQIGIPQESVASIRRVCASARLLLRRDRMVRPTGGKEIEITEEGWGGFREALYNLTLSKGASERDAEAVSLYYVPKTPKWTYADVCREMGLSIMSDSLSKVIRRRRTDIRTKELGDIGEKFVVSQLDILSPTWGGGGDDVPDVKIGDWEFNVKTTLTDSIRKYEPTTPENSCDNGHVILLMPRLLECRLYPITGEHTMINGRKGSLVAIGQLGKSIKELMHSE